MYLIYPLKLWVQSILKDKKQKAIKKKKVYKETLLASQVYREDIVLILSLVKNGRLLFYAVICFSDWQ